MIHHVELQVAHGKLLGEADFLVLRLRCDGQQPEHCGAGKAA